jgi:hypothetical protein
MNMMLPPTKVKVLKSFYTLRDPRAFHPCPELHHRRAAQFLCPNLSSCPLAEDMGDRKSERITLTPTPSTTMEFLSSNAPHALMQTLLFAVAVAIQLGTSYCMFSVNDAFIQSIAWNASMPTSTSCFGEFSKSKTRVLWLLSSRHVKWQNVDVLSNVRRSCRRRTSCLDWLVRIARSSYGDEGTCQERSRGKRKYVRESLMSFVSLCVL